MLITKTRLTQKTTLTGKGKNENDRFVLAQTCLLYIFTAISTLLIGYRYLGI